MTGSPRIPVTVIGGYLGAGKTTLVNHLLHQIASDAGGERVAVLVNDFGAIDIDSALVTARDGDTIRLANGCICCSLSEGFTQAMQRIDELDPRPDRLVIETSGVADPGAVAQYAHLPGFRLDAVVVLVDAETIRTRATDRYVGRQVVEQIAHADVVVLNKADLVDATALAELTEWVGGHVSHASVITAVQACVPRHVLFEPDTAGQQPHGRHTHIGTHPTHGTWSLTGDDPIDRTRWEALVASLPLSIVRAKGFVSFVGDPVPRVFQKVGSRVAHSPAPDGPRSSTDRREPMCRLVFIGLPPIDQDAAIERLALDLGLRMAVDPTPLEGPV